MTRERGAVPMSRQFQASATQGYRIAVKTSNFRHASTNASAYVKLVSAAGPSKAIGLHYGDASRRSSLSASFRKPKKFLKGSTEITETEAEVSEPITDVIVGLDGQDCWHLDSVILENETATTNKL